MVMGGFVPVVNINGVKAGDLVLDGVTIAKIFLGEVKSWDDVLRSSSIPMPSYPPRRSR
jgi:phosphate transport system substrate-binding protein